MKTNNSIYKFFAILALLCCCQIIMWGQAAVGEYYNLASHSISVLDEVRARRVSDNKDVGNGYRNGVDERIGNVFDGNDNSYWKSTRYGETYLYFTFKYRIDIDVVRIFQGGNTQERSTEIVAYTSSNGNNWEEVQTFSSLNRNNRTVCLRFNETLNTRYLRLKLTPDRTFHDRDDDNVTYKLAINEIDFQYENVETVGTIQSKRAKWFDIASDLNLSSQSLGTFDADQEYFNAAMSAGSNRIQAAHTYIDTIYVHKGTTVNLQIPTQSDGGSASTPTYQRWYSYRTMGTFETNHEDGVFDLLVPASSDASVYRFTNGYVGAPLGSVANSMNFYYPTNTEFSQWFPDASQDNDWFVVACDVSGYTDFSQDFNSKGNNGTVTKDNIIAQCARDFRENNWYEPTLALRVIYYIVGVDERVSGSQQKEDNWKQGHGRLTTTAYQGGGTADDKHYLEEHDITFPNSHLSNRTHELVALSKDARAYAIPDAGKEENAVLNVSIVDNNAGIAFRQANTGTEWVWEEGRRVEREYTYYTNVTSTTLSGTNRIISFVANTVPQGTEVRDNTSMPWTVADGSTATILVTKTYNGVTYNIARFNLTFVANSIPLTQTQVSQLGTQVAEGKSWNFAYRSPSWMGTNLTKLTEQTFDFDGTVPELASAYVQSDYFPFPLAWDNISYAFFDGSVWRDFAGNANYTRDEQKFWYPEFGYYAITNDYIGYGDQGGRNNNRPTMDTQDTEELLAKPHSEYHIYVDASDRPGIIARIPFTEKLCIGSELFCTAWIKSACENGSDDGAVLFTVMGVSTEEQNGREVTTYTPLYTHSSGQIHQTTYLTAGDPGTGEGTNEWYQLYFSFINNNPDAENFDTYVLQIENNSASTDGGDYYFDDIKVYIAKPSAKVMQKEFACTDERTLMNIELDWDRLTSRLGGEGEEGTKAIDFCFVDETVYNNKYDELINNAGGEDNLSEEQISEYKTLAINAALEWVGNGTEWNEQLLTLHYYNKFDSNLVYGTDGKTTALENLDQNSNAYFYGIGSEDDVAGRRLTVDFYADLSPNRPYLLLIKPHTDDEPLASDFSLLIGDSCSIQTRFYVEAQTLVKVNGEVVNPSKSFCEGQIFNFSAQLRAPNGVDEDGNDIYVVVDEGVYYDWFFGTETEFLMADGDFNNVSLKEALSDFRALYPNADELNETDTPYSDEPRPVFGSSEDYDGGTVVFDKNDFDIIKHYLELTGDEGGLNNVLILHRENLDITILNEGLELVVIPIQTLVPPSESGFDPTKWAQICWEHVSVVLSVNGNAPQLRAGFNTVEYPSSDFNPALRIGLDQIKQASEQSLTVDLRGATVVTETATHLGVNRKYGDIYLIGSNDPAYADYFKDTNFDQYSLPIGSVTALTAQDYSENPNAPSYMQIKFNLDNQESGFVFLPKEGYTYTFAVYFEEKGGGDDDVVYNTCYGSFPVDMKVVPKYQKWVGNELLNWNNDENWQRMSSSELYKTKDEASDYLTDGNNNCISGFVPMLFTNVVMPTNSKAELYMAGYAQGGALGSEHSWTGSANRPEAMGDPTENIQYDLMVYDDGSRLTTQRFRVNICNDIHFAPGAQMLHAEQLLYNKAWMDVNMSTKQWTLMSLPLKDVVSGDWYTSTTGTQTELPYFKDITFGTDNDRLNPAVYQRSWDTDATIVDEGSVAVGFDVSTPVWSAAYNDASVPYVAGGGYSLSARDVTGGNGTLSFRFPKADTQYDYSTDTFTRNNSGKLLISGLLNRSNPLQYDPQDEVTAELTASQDGKYMIVGNPYMAPLDLQKFFEVNAGTDGNLKGMYWSETDGGTAAGGTDSQGGQWITPTGTETIQPFGAFFVQLKDGATDNTVKFTADMQKFETTTGDEAATTAFTITADNGNERSGAALAYADNADNTFKATEDTRLMRNLLGNNANELSVYTVAGDNAASVNRVKDLRQVPLGLFANSGDVTTLTFTGVDALMEPSLYDAELNTEMPITEGMTLSVDGASHGRYFIRSRGAGDGTTGITDVTAGDDGVSVYSVVQGQVVVSAGAELREVRVYSVGGALLKSEGIDGGRTAVTISDVDSGVAIVRVTTADGAATRKITVK